MLFVKRLSIGWLKHWKDWFLLKSVLLLLLRPPCGIGQLSGCIFATKACIDSRGKNLLNSNMSSTCLRNMVNIGPLTAEIVSGVWGTPANFNGFHVLASLLQWRRSPEANQTLHDVWPFPGLVHYIYIFSCKIHFTFKSLVLLYWQRYCTTFQQRASAKTLRRPTRNGISELSQRAPPIFGRAAITLVIDPHSSYSCFMFG